MAVIARLRECQPERFILLAESKRKIKEISFLLRMLNTCGIKFRATTSLSR